MNDQYPPQNNDDHTELFRQLEGLDDDIVQAHLDEAVDIAELDAKTAADEREIIKAIRTSSEELPMEVNMAIKVLEQRPELGAMSAILRLRFSKNALRENSEQHVEVVERVLWHISHLTDLVKSFGDKKQIQVEIIDDNFLGYEIKMSLLRAVDVISDQEGLDLNDVNAVHEALSELYKEKDHNAHMAVLRAKAMQLVLKYEGEFLDRYKIHPDDPVWAKLRFAAVRKIVLKKEFEEKPIQVPDISRSEELNVLRLSAEEYEKFIDEMYALLDAS